MIVYKIKNWPKFQHFKDRNPIWIKLYREILDDYDINLLSSDAFKFLIQLWLVASEDPTQEGNLPDIEKLSFRLRVNKNKCLDLLKQLDSFLISTEHQDDAPRREEKRREEGAQFCAKESFAEFWELYPKKKSKGDAEKVYLRQISSKQLHLEVLAGVQRAITSKDWCKDGGKYIPYPATWLRAKGWLDDLGHPNFASVANVIPPPPEDLSGYEHV